MKRITIIASGTRGDVQPAIALGKALWMAGFGVRIAAGIGFRGWIEGHGLEAAPSEVDMEAVMATDIGRAWVDRGHDQLAQLRLMRGIIDAVGPRLIRDAWDACQDADAVISSFTSDTYALAIGERLDVPVLSGPLQPTLIATRDGRAMTSAPLPRRVSQVNEWFGRLFLEPFPWRLYGRHVNEFRREIGLPSQTSRQNVAARRRMTVLHGVSPHVMPMPSDWPVHFHVTGYWYLDEEDGWEPPAELVGFLAAGPPPICVGFGSMIGSDPEGTLRLVVEAVHEAGQRAVLLGGWARVAPSSLPPEILVLPSAPHGWLFPRMAAVVHHGGAGTTAAAFRAGVPMVIIPHLGDQPYWGERVAALGVGPKPLPRHRLTAAKLGRAVQRAVGDETMRRDARALAAKVRVEDGLGHAADVIRETLGWAPSTVGGSGDD